MYINKIFLSHSLNHCFCASRNNWNLKIFNIEFNYATSTTHLATSTTYLATLTKHLVTLTTHLVTNSINNDSIGTTQTAKTWQVATTTTWMAISTTTSTKRLNTTSRMLVSVGDVLKWSTTTVKTMCHHRPTILHQMDWFLHP